MGHSSHPAPIRFPCTLHSLGTLVRARLALSSLGRADRKQCPATELLGQDDCGPGRVSAGRPDGHWGPPRGLEMEGATRRDTKGGT